MAEYLECTTQIAPILTTLFSLTLKTGKIPDDWRYASVCPAFRKGDKNNPFRTCCNKQYHETSRIQ